MKTSGTSSGGVGSSTLLPASPGAPATGKKTSLSLAKLQKLIASHAASGEGLEIWSVGVSKTQDTESAVRMCLFKFYHSC